MDDRKMELLYDMLKYYLIMRPQKYDSFYEKLWD